jgi:ADP-heptose:LPS heptosyltransferase
MTSVLLVRLSAMGDVVQSLGALAALHAARPDLRLHLVTQREFAPLLQGLPGLQSVVEHDRRGGLGAVRQTAGALRALRCDVALDLQGNFKSAWFAWCSRARQRIGASAPWRQEPWSRVLLTRTVAVDGPAHPALVAHAVVRALAPAAELLLPRLAAAAGEVEAAAARVRAAGIDPARPFRVVAVGDPGDPRSQRPDALRRELASARLPVLLLLGPREAQLAVPGGVPVLRQAAGRLRELVALGALVAQGGGDVVGCDRGPGHVLAAAGAPTAILSGPQDPAATAPPAATVLLHGSPPPCRPCRRRRCRHELGPVGVDFASAAGRELPPARWLPGGRT